MTVEVDKPTLISPQVFHNFLFACLSLLLWIPLFSKVSIVVDCQKRAYSWIYDFEDLPTSVYKACWKYVIRYIYEFMVHFYTRNPQKLIANE